MTAPRSDPAALRRFADARWAALTMGRRPAADEVAAMTEAMFRVAVHPGTARADAVDLLDRAHRADPRDARFAYHLGRMALEDGRPAEAEAWLSTARRTGPAGHRSDAHRIDAHRIDAHLVVALRRLADGETADAAQRAGYRSRARALSAAVRAAGLTGCGWPGIYDIDFDEGLRAEVTEHAWAALRPALAAIRDLADRPGGVRAFVVAAICWLIRGYPPEDVTDLADGLPATDHRASYLLTRVCRLFTGPADDLPGQLAQALNRGELPPVLVALIHHRRLFPGVRAFPELGALRAAQWFRTDDVPQGSAARHVSVLDAAVDAMRARPVMPGADRPARTGARTAADAAARLGELTAEAETLTAHRAAVSKVLTGPLKAADRGARTAEERATVAADHAALTGALHLIIEAATAAHEQTERFKGELGHLGAADLGDDFTGRVDAVLQDLAGLKQSGNVHRLLKRVKHADAGRPGTAPSPAAQAVADAVAERYGAAAEPAPVAPAPAPTDVAAAVARAHAAVAEIFADAERSLAPYPDSVTATHLRALVLGRLAENQYRMGLVVPARRTWHRLLAENGPGAPAYRNLAVAALGDGDEHHATEAWRRYLAELYRLPDAAAERDRVHGVLAAAYLPPGLRRDTADGEDAATIRFLAGGRAVRAATTHLGRRDPHAAPAIVQRIEVKQRIERALTGPAPWALGVAAVRVITNLRLVDRLPLDPDHGVTYRAALSLGIGDPAERLAQLDDLRGRAVRTAVSRIVADAARQDAALPRRYRDLLTAWVHSDITAEESYPLDHARWLYDARTAAAVEAAAEDPRRSTPELRDAQLALHRWCLLLPGVTGPARDLALLTELSGDAEGAWQILVRIMPGAVHPIGLRHAVHQAAAIGWKMKRYGDVATIVTDAVARLPEDESLWELVENVHVAMAAHRQHSGRDPQAVTRRFRGWYARTAARHGPAFRAAAGKVLQRLEEGRFTDA